MKQREIADIWKEALKKLEETTSKPEYQRWIFPIVPVSLVDSTLSLGTPNDFSKRYVEEHYIPFIKDAIKSVLGESGDITVKLEIIPPPRRYSEKEEIPPLLCDGDLDYPSISTQERLSFTDYPETPARYFAEPHNDDPHYMPVLPGDHSTLKERYTFENFVRGTSNEVAYAAAFAVATDPGRVYNPLFLYGGVGLGKTHLMHAIGNHILKNNPKMRVLYISSERFLNDFIASIREGKAREFQNRYRNVDVLLVDDIQFLYTKERTQEEFFHTFNALHDAEKAIILSGDRHPKDIKIIEDRLRSRFEWGLPVDITPPDLETRIAILQKKAILDNLDIPSDVFTMIASRIDTNVRELEGALTRVVAQASLENKKVTMEIASRAMEGSYPTEHTRFITLELILDMTSSHFKIPTADLLSKKRTQEIAFARQVAMYLCRKLTDTSLKKISSYFNKQDHTTVMHAYDKIMKECEENPQFNKELGDLIDLIQKM